MGFDKLDLRAGNRGTDGDRRPQLKSQRQIIELRSREQREREREHRERDEGNYLCSWNRFENFAFHLQRRRREQRMEYKFCTVSLPSFSFELLCLQLTMWETVVYGGVPLRDLNTQKLWFRLADKFCTQTDTHNCVHVHTDMHMYGVRVYYIRCKGNGTETDFINIKLVKPGRKNGTMWILLVAKSKTKRTTFFCMLGWVWTLCIHSEKNINKSVDTYKFIYSIENQGFM